MKPRVAYIDSLNFSSEDLEAFFDDEDYIIEPVKGIGIFEPKKWVEAFKQPLKRNIIEAKILHTSTGLELPIKRFSKSKSKQTLEFGGLHAYNDKSKLLLSTLQSIQEKIQDEVITRVDVAIDFIDKVPTRVIRALKKSRKPFQWKNSIYLKTESEKKTNYNVNIIMYQKSIKENLDINIVRLEFSFRANYLKATYRVKDLAPLYLKIQKSIKRFSGLEVEIQPL